MGRLNLARSSFLRWQNPNRLQIGINLLQPFAYGYPFANGGADATVMPDARLTGYKTVGFDFIRMAVDPEPLLSADSASNTTTTVLDSRIAEVIAGAKRRTALGLKVIIDVHFHGLTQTYAAGWNYTDVLDGGTKATRTGFVLARLASAIHAENKFGLSSGMVAYEIFNEPPSPTEYATASWITQLRTWFAQVRAALPRHTIIISGNNLGALNGTAAGDFTSGLTALTPSHYDANTGFAYHAYESAVFTHQGVTGKIYEYMHDLKFPSGDHVGGQSAAESAYEAAWTAAGGSAEALNAVVTQTGWSSSIAEYFNTYGTKAKLLTRQNIVTNWSDAASLPRKNVMITECGVNFAHASLDASDTSAANFITAIRENAIAGGLNCIAIHEAQGSDFGIQGTSTPWAINSSIQTAVFP